MNRLRVSAVVFALVTAYTGAAGGAVLVDLPWTNTAQIQTPLNNTLFGTLEHLAALNLHYGSQPAAGMLNGIRFHDVRLVSYDATGLNTASGAISPTFYPGVTVDYDFSREGDNRALANSSITGSDAGVANRIAQGNRYFGVPANSNHTMTFRGLDPGLPVYVQLIGGQHGWNDTTTVFANGVNLGPWASNRTNQTAGLFGFEAQADATGAVHVELQTSRFGGMAAAMVMATAPLPPAPTPLANLPVTQGLNYWLDASNIDGFANSTLTDGAPVASWTDLAAGNNALVRPSTADTAPVYVADAVGGRPAVRFDDLSDRLTSYGTSTWGTVFVVNSVDPTSPALTGILGRSNADFGIRRDGVADGRWRGNPGHTNTGDFSHGGAFYVNGGYTDMAALDTWHALKAVPPGPVANQAGPQLGGYNNGAHAREFLGSVAEVLVYDRTLSPTESLWVGKYLADKYTLPLAVDQTVTNTDQIVAQPFATTGARHVAVNFRYNSPAVTGSLHGIRFDNITLSGSTPPAGPFDLTANPTKATLELNFPFTSDNAGRNQNAGVTGTDAAAANAVFSEVFYIGGTNHPSATMTFSGLDPSKEVYVQLLGGDSNWNGDLLVKANSEIVGTWTSVADSNPNTGSLYGFFTQVDPQGRLELDFSITAGNFAGISGVILSVPEPSALLLLAFGFLTLLARRRK